MATPGSPETVFTNTTVDAPIAPPDLVLTDAQEDTVVAFRMITSALSLLGAIFMLGSMVYFKKTKALSSRLILYLTISACGEAVFNLLTIIVYEQEEELSGLCYFQGLGTQLFQLSGFLWTTVISFNLYMVVVRHKSNLTLYEKPYHIFVWVATGTFTVVPMFTSSYGHAGVWCWIKRGGVSTVFRFVTFYIPLYICIGLMIYMYFKIIGTVKRTMQGQTDLEERDKRRASRAMDRLRLYPVIFIALYICPTINRVVNWATNDEYFLLYLAQVMTAPLLGFVNVFAYGMDEDMRRKYTMCLLKRGVCTCCISEIPPENLDAPSKDDDDDDDDDDEYFQDDVQGASPVFPDEQTLSNQL